LGSTFITDKADAIWKLASPTPNSAMKNRNFLA